MTFRNELKFFVSSADLAILSTRIKNLTTLDSHQNNPDGYTITSLYFDNIYDKCLNETIDGYDNRNKYRLRIYNNNPSFIKMEKKSKVHGMTAKNSFPVTIHECNNLMKCIIPKIDNSTPECAKKIYAEMKIYGLRPKCIVQYLRRAFVFNAGNVRITFDTNICASSQIKDFLCPKHTDIPLLKTDTQILEVKYDNFLPEHLRAALDLNKLQQSSFSKYGYARKILNL